MTPFEDQASYLDAVTAARNAATAYYAGDESPLDDATYDQLVARIAATEAANPEWKASDGLLDQVAAGTQAGGDVEHSTPMLSLDNVFSAEELTTWHGRLVNAVGPLEVTVEPKLDGLAIAGRYVDGELTLVATRGNGETGEDVTSQSRRIAGLPVKLTEAVTCEVRGEVFMTDADFEAANELRELHGEARFANPRNAAAGSLRAINRSYAVPLSFAAYDAVATDALAGLGSHTATMSRVAELGVAIASALVGTRGSFDDAAEVAETVERLGRDRGELPFQIDGAVIKADRHDLREQAGATSKAPRWATAYKYPADLRLTRLVGIELQSGRTGIVTPVAVLAPVEVGGVTVTAATLSNPSEVVRKDLRVGDEVWVRRAGEVIPEVVGVNLDARPADAEPWQVPTACPRCDGELDTSQRRWRCPNRTCGTPEAVRYYASRKALDIEGLGDTLVRALVDAGLVTDPADLYGLSVEDIAALPRHGETSAAKVVAQIEASKQQPLRRVLTGLGIRTTGERLCRRITAHFGTLEKIRAASVEEMARVDGVGDVKAEVIVAELAELSDMIDRLVAAGVTVEEDKRPETDAAASSVLAGKKVVVSGTVPGMTRTEAQEAVERLGGKVSGSVSKNTDVLVAGDGAGSKLTKAESLGVEVMDAATFAAIASA